MQQEAIKPKEFFDFWYQVQAHLTDMVDRIPEAHLEWKPEGMQRSFGDLLRHIVETRDWWVAKVLEEPGDCKDITRDNCGDRDRIKVELERSYEQVKAVYKKWTEEGLRRRYTLPDSEGAMVTGLWVLWHVIEHDIHHRAQVMTYLRLFGIAPPPI